VDFSDPRGFPRGLPPQLEILTLRRRGKYGYQWSTLDAIKHIRETPLWKQHVVNDDRFISDALNGTLPEVSWLVTGDDSETSPVERVLR